MLERQKGFDSFSLLILLLPLPFFNALCSVGLLNYCCAGPPRVELVDTVAGMMRGKRDGDILVDRFNIPLSKNDLDRLKPRQWLNDSVSGTPVLF